MPKLIGDAALESRGVRLPPNVWRRIDQLSGGKPGPFVRAAVEAYLRLVPDMPKQHESVPDDVVEFS